MAESLELVIWHSQESRMEDTNFDTSREDELASQLASSVGTKEIAMELLRSGASLAPGKDCAGEAFRWACANGIHGVVASMLSMRDTYGYDIVNFARSGEGTPLTESAGNGHKAVVEALLGHSADVNSSDLHGATALMRAAQSGNVEICLTLAKNGADPDARDNNGKTALDLANEAGNANAAAVLKAMVDNQTVSLGPVRRDDQGRQDGHTARSPRMSC